MVIENKKADIFRLKKCEKQGSFGKKKLMILNKEKINFTKGREGGTKKRDWDKEGSKLEVKSNGKDVMLS